MEKDKVPQDDENVFEGLSKVVYAIDKDGKYQKVPTVGWEPENVALSQAWEVVNEKVKQAKIFVGEGKSSVLLVHMEKNMLDLTMLAEYMDFSKRKVKSHLDPEVFKALDKETLEKYAYVFKISLDELLKLD